MKTAILSYYTKEFQVLADVALPNTQAYCDRWGFDHVVRAPEKLEHYYAIGRIKYLLGILSNYEMVWVLNTHAFIMNHTIDVRSFVDQEHDFFITKDVNGINAGVYIVRNTPTAKEFMEVVYERSLHESHPWLEQKVLQDIERDGTYGPRMKIVPHPSFNSYRHFYYNHPATNPGNFEKGSFVLHIPGRPVQYSGGELSEVRASIFKSKEIQDMIVR